MRLHKTGKYDFDKRLGQLIFAGEYSTGTVAINAGATTLEGTGVVWTSSMADRYIRINGEGTLYRVTSFTDSDTLEIETYNGETNLSGVTYQIIEPRKAMPDRFRCFAFPYTDDKTLPVLKKAPLETIQMWYRIDYRVDQVSHYNIESVENATTSIPEPYMWVYPAPSTQKIIDFPYYVLPALHTTDSDKFELPEEAEDVLFSFIDAEIAKHKGKPDWLAMMATAKDAARDALADFLFVCEDNQSMEWYPEMFTEMGDRLDQASFQINTG